MFPEDLRRFCESSGRSRWRKPSGWNSILHSAAAFLPSPSAVLLPFIMVSFHPPPSIFISWAVSRLAPTFCDFLPPPTIRLQAGGEHLSLAEQWAPGSHPSHTSVTSTALLTHHQASATSSPSANERGHHSSPEIIRGGATPVTPVIQLG